MREYNGGAINQKPLLTLSFENCDIDRAEATALNFMLKAGYISNISVTQCDFDDDESSGIVQEGLKANQSLTNVHFTSDDAFDRANLMNGVLDMVSTNHKISTLTLDMMNGPTFWDVYRSVEGSTTLQNLKLHNASLNDSAVGALMKLCQIVKSLKEISFQNCEFTPSGIQFLLEELSKNVALIHLGFAHCTILEPYSSPFELRWRDVQVVSFELSTAMVGQESLPSLFGGIADNSHILTVDLCWVTASDEDFQSMCDTLISGNSGPTTLVMEENVQHRTPMIIEALQQATRLTTLSIGDLDEAGLVLFAQGLSNMPSLRQLILGFRGGEYHYSEEFFISICASLEVNTTLWSLSLKGVDSDDAMVRAYLPRIRYLLSINRVGRNLLLAADVPVGIWSHVLARCPRDPDGIYFVLQENPIW
jgi:hypothetical protein